MAAIWRRYDSGLKDQISGTLLAYFAQLFRIQIQPKYNLSRSMDNIFSLEKNYADGMVAHARAEMPDECCGILAGVEGQVLKLYRTINAEHSPFRYNIEPRELFAIYQEIEKMGWNLLGIYHSHTHTEAYPSPVDIKYAYLPESLYFIISLSDPDRPVIRAFRIAQGKIRLHAGITIFHHFFK
jgi:proteasome lid subunit RPN8/RPN11